MCRSIGQRRVTERGAGVDDENWYPMLKIARMNVLCGVTGKVATFSKKSFQLRSDWNRYCSTFEVYIAVTVAPCSRTQAPTARSALGPAKSPVTGTMRLRDSRSLTKRNASSV